MQRYFVKEKFDNTFCLSKDDSYHIVTVMRMNISDKIEVVYDSECYVCKIISLDDLVKCEIVSKIDSIDNNMPKVFIAQALVKEQKMDYILQKCCELGVSGIIPVSTERSIVNLDGKIDKKILRWNKVLKEASEQSKRVDIPVINDVLTLKKIVDLDFDYKIICSVNEKSKSIKSVLSKIDNSATILFVIGPEGGLSLSEENYLIDNGFIPVTFGSFVLRTETASVYALSAVNYEFLR